MKVAYLLGSLNRGGTETLILDLFKHSCDLPFDIIGVHRKDGILREAFYDCGKSIYKISPRFPYDPIYLWKLRQLLLREKVDVVHAQQILDACYACIALLGTKVKVVYSIHGYYDGIEKKIDRRIQRATKKTSRTFFVSEYQRQHYIETLSLDQDKTAVVYNGISFDKLIHPRRKLIDMSKPLKLGMVGNFVAVREHYTVCQFLKLLKDDNVAFEFYFVGRKDNNEPWLYDDCVRYCQENGLLDCVHFLGACNDVPQLLSEWDAFIYSTDHDTFGIAVIEAIASGLPTFVNDYAVMKEVTQDGRWAYLYTTKDPEDLLIQFKKFIENQDLYYNNALQDADEVRKTYSIERHIEKLSNCYLSL